MPRRPSQLTEESFLKDVAEHTVSIRMDNGVYRHLFCRKPGTGVNYFEVVTWPGTLAYTGDMGTFVFSRVVDMFTFFRGGDTGELRINPGYWSEKLEAVDRDGRQGGYSEYSPQKVRDHIEEKVAEWLEGHDFSEFESDEKESADQTAKVATQLREALDDEVFCHLDDAEGRVREALNGFEFKTESSLKYPGIVGCGETFQFHDTWEWDCHEYTYHFLWCCYALVWAVRQYDALTAPAAAEGVLA
jgi:hypothetical protein